MDFAVVERQHDRTLVDVDALAVTEKWVAGKVELVYPGDPAVSDAVAGGRIC